MVPCMTCQWPGKVQMKRYCPGWSGILKWVVCEVPGLMTWVKATTSGVSGT